MSSQGFVIFEISFAEVAVQFGVEPVSDDLVYLNSDVVTVDVSVGSVLHSKPTATTLTHEGSLGAVTLRDMSQQNFLGFVIELTESVAGTEVTFPNFPVAFYFFLNSTINSSQQIAVTVDQVTEWKPVHLFRGEILVELLQFLHTSIIHHFFTLLGVFK